MSSARSSLAKLSGAACFIGMLTLGFCAELPIPVPGGALVPFEIVSTPIRELAAQSVILTFNHVEGESYFLEQSLDARTWIPSVETAITNGLVRLEAMPPMNFFRLRASTRSEPPLLHIEETSTFRTNGYTFSLQSATLRGWDHWVQSRTDHLSEWQNFAPMQNHAGFPIDEPLVQSSEFRVFAKPPVERESFDAFLIGGQSNALLLENNYLNKIPGVLHLDGNWGFGAISKYDSTRTNIYSFSFAASAGEEIHAATGRPVLLFPVARGSTSIKYWHPFADRTDPTSPFGQLVTRAKIAAPHGLQAILYYGHESSSTEPHFSTYAQDWTQLLNELRKDLGDVPIIYTQLAKNSIPALNEAQHAAAELQRTMESGQPAGLQNHFMVVAFDLPLFDNVHLTPAGQYTLGQRVALAVRQHVYGQDVDGTGPRLISLFHPGTARDVIEVIFNQPINQCTNAYDQQFRVFDEETEISNFTVDRNNAGNGVRIQLSRSPTGEVYVSYGNTVPLLHQFLTNVVRNALGLPAPRFGKLPVE